MDKFNRVREIVSKILEVPISEINIDSKKEDFEKWDSLNQLNLIMELEAEFAVSIPMEEIANINSLKAILGVI
ncbi:MULTISPECIES: acyl carrier protein [Paenibacillus]|uniref:acyl carrier protein n=1 Tax=Paenibacillus TaxID=44249 RepID=UPI0017825311|nr:MULTISPECIES: acyl carrier protein [unclassified Paenibacillus]MBD8840705.1 acyl carrier protein [Paenibacillus sp. CFBP 13594]QZN76539.1 acyl carrier protein [Paenibacillus sp. DR312]